MAYSKVNPVQLQTDLREYVAEVIFDKHDGSRRVMKCTLKRNFLPENYDPQSDGPVTNILKVWDVEVHGWRSIDTTRVLSCQIVSGYD